MRKHFSFCIHTYLMASKYPLAAATCNGVAPVRGWQRLAGSPFVSQWRASRMIHSSSARLATSTSDERWTNYKVSYTLQKRIINN